MPSRLIPRPAPRLLALAVAAAAAAADDDDKTTTQCLGEFAPCGTSATYCAMLPTCPATAACAAGQYLCPSDSKTCVDSAEQYTTCPNLSGTHLDWTLGTEERLDYLVAHTTLAEQAAQLTNRAPAIPDLGIPAYNYLNDDQHGVGRTKEKATVFPNGCALGATWAKDTLHEVGMAIGAEARGLHRFFLNELGNGDRQLSCNGCGLTLYAPNLNLVKDPRWGRAQEVFGEDPILMSGLVTNLVLGIQNNSAGNAADADGRLLAGACCKHFAVYDLETVPTDRHHYDAANVTARNFWETYMPAFKACVQEAKGSHVMCSYNSLNGVPTCANGGLLNTVLREKWGFDGFVVSDYDAWTEMKDTHKYVDSYEDAAAAGLSNGLDQEGTTGSPSVIQAIPSAVAAGKVKATQVAQAFRRLFRSRIRLGMLDPPLKVKYNALGHEQAQSPSHLQTALKAARQAITLYKNDNETLPLPGAKGRWAKGSILLAGPQGALPGILMGNYADSASAGGWGELILSTLSKRAAGPDGPPACNGSQFEDGVDFFQIGNTQRPAKDAADCCALCQADDRCRFFGFTKAEKSCWFKETDDGRVQDSNVVSGSCGQDAVTFAQACATVDCKEGAGGQLFDAAVAAAGQPEVEVIVVTLGLLFGNLCTGWFGYHPDSPACEAEAWDRTTLDLPGHQADLVVALRKANPAAKIVALLIHGGSLVLGDAVESAVDAIVDAWYPGLKGAQAIADVLFGDVSPAGRTAVTWYTSDQALPAPGNPDFYADGGITYRFYEKDVKYPFGYGLTYTTFSYSSLKVTTTTAVALSDTCATFEATFNLKNTGAVDSEEVVQLYIKQPNASVPVPKVRLAAFDRVFVKAGQTIAVTLQISPDTHIIVRDDGQTASIYEAGSTAVFVEPGPLEVHVGGGQPGFYIGGLSATIQVPGNAAVLLDDCT